MHKFIIRVSALISACLLFWLFASLMGDGGFKRHITMSGIYSVCKVGGYPVVCFNDADSKSSSPYCMPLSEVGGKCL